MLPSELIADPDKWTQDAEARDEHGDEVASGSRKAVRWCLVGAVRKCVRDRLRVMFWPNLRAKLPGGHSLESFNDTAGRTHAEVIDLLKSVGL